MLTITPSLWVRSLKWIVWSRTRGVGAPPGKFLAEYYSTPEASLKKNIKHFFKLAMHEVRFTRAFLRSHYKITIIIIIIMSCHQHGYRWLFFATLLYRPLLPAGLQEYTLYWRRAVVCMYVLAARLAFARSCEGVHRNTLLMNSSLLLQQCLACLVCLT